MKTKFKQVLQFKSPEPEKTGKPVWPVFTPFAGCPFKCVYCSQYAQTGQTARDPKQTAREMTSGVLARYQKTGHPVALGFFGGTFTAMNQGAMISLLEQAWYLKKKGAVNHIRCSTRPDCIDDQVLNILKDYNLDMVELGIQSFDNQTLESSNRGYSCAQAVHACQLVKKFGLELGIQLLPGLPGSGCAGFIRDIRVTADIAPDIVRIYPCLVLKGTPLAEKMHRGFYRPWSLQTVVAMISLALLNLWFKKIPVIRMGLTPEPELIKNILAGPWHPALGAICRSAAIKSYFLFQLGKTRAKPSLIYIPEKNVSDFWGYNRMNARTYLQKGISREMVRPWGKRYFRIYFS